MTRLPVACKYSIAPSPPKSYQLTSAKLGPSRSMPFSNSCAARALLAHYSNDGHAERFRGLAYGRKIVGQLPGQSPPLPGGADASRDL